MSTSNIAPGTLLLGKYRIERTLGEGGMGVVALAMHEQLQERVALKFLLPEVMHNQEVVQRFLREAQAAVKLKSEHVARVIDVGTLEGGVPYMVMEFLDGVDLSQYLAQTGTLSPDIAVDYILQACEALAEAHALGIVHRDVKPANFFITRRPDGTPLVKVLDFGISKAPVGIDGGLTKTQSVMGTPSYMSPEQMRSSRDVDARTDIWALGVVLYELLAGRRPFPSETFSELCIQVAVDPLPPLTLPHLPTGLADVVHHCLEKDPGRRFANVAELAASLAPFAGNQRQAQVCVERASRMLGLPGPPVPQLPMAGMPTAHASPSSITSGAGEMLTTGHPASSRRGLVIALGAVAALAVVIVIAVVATGGAPAQSASAGDAGIRAGGATVEQGQTIDAGVATATTLADAAPVAEAETPIDAASERATAKPDEAEARAEKERLAREKRAERRARERAAAERRAKEREKRSGGSKDGDEDDILGSRH